MSTKGREVHCSAARAGGCDLQRPRASTTRPVRSIRRAPWRTACCLPLRQAECVRVAVMDAHGRKASSNPIDLTGIAPTGRFAVTSHASG